MDSEGDIKNLYGYTKNDLGCRGIHSSQFLHIPLSQAAETFRARNAIFSSSVCYGVPGAKGFRDHETGHRTEYILLPCSQLRTLMEQFTLSGFLATKMFCHVIQTNPAMTESVVEVFIKCSRS